MKHHKSSLDICSRNAWITWHKYMKVCLVHTCSFYFYHWYITLYDFTAKWQKIKLIMLSKLQLWSCFFQTTYSSDAFGNSSCPLGEWTWWFDAVDEGASDLQGLPLGGAVPPTSTGWPTNISDVSGVVGFKISSRFLLIYTALTGGLTQASMGSNVW